MKDIKDKKQSEESEQVTNTEEVEEKAEGAIEDLEEPINKDKREIEYLKDQLARSVADFRNLEKRHQEEKQEFAKYANRELLYKLLPAFDMLFLAEKHVEDQGIKLTIKNIHDVFSEIGIQKIETNNAKFDANFMECVDTEDGEAGMVLKEIKPGFVLHGKLLSPATVVVGRKK